MPLRGAVVAVLLASSLLAACGRSEDRPARDSAVAADSVDDTAGTRPPSIAYSREREYDLTGDGRPERLVLTAKGPRADSLDVRLVIWDADGSMLLEDAWESRYYFEYLDRASMSDDEVADTVGAQLERVLSDSSFGGPVRLVLGPTIEASPETARESVEHDVASMLWREANRVPVGTPLPAHAYDSVQAILRGGVDRDRVDRLMREVREHSRWFMLFRGGEDTQVLAWSPSERRLVTVFSCC